LLFPPAGEIFRSRLKLAELSDGIKSMKNFKNFYEQFLRDSYRFWKKAAENENTPDFSKGVDLIGQ